MEAIIGIDPAPVFQTWVLFDGHRILDKGHMSIDDMAILLPRMKYAVACEWIESFGMAVGQEVFQTVFAIGYMHRCKPMRLVPRRDVKLHLCNSSKAKDSNIRQALIDKVGPVGTKLKPGPTYGISTHFWSALAVAVTALEIPKTAHEATFASGLGCQQRESEFVIT